MRGREGYYNNRVVGNKYCNSMYAVYTKLGMNMISKPQPF